MVFPLIDLTGKKIIVAGASSGIGAETSRLLSKLGASVILVARREQQLQETLATMEGDSHRYYCKDLSLLDEIEQYNIVSRIVNNEHHDHDEDHHHEHEEGCSCGHHHGHDHGARRKDLFRQCQVS